MPRCRLRHTTKTLLAAVFAVAAPLGAQATAAQAQTRVVEQGTPVYVQGTGICTIGYNDPARTAASPPHTAAPRARASS